MFGLYHRVYSRDAAAATLLVSLIALLGAGLHNVADGFADVQASSSPILHWGGAVAIELGVVAIGLTIAVRAKSGRANRRLYLGILLFVAASIFANYDASLEALTGSTITWRAIQGLDAWTLAKAALLGGAIPLMVLLVIESLRELAAEGASETVSKEHGPVAAQAPKTRDEARNGHTPLPRAPISEKFDGRRPRSATPTAMRELLREEPAISATEVARRLNIGRATVYRWRDLIGARRDAGAWVLK